MLGFQRGLAGLVLAAAAFSAGLFAQSAPKSGSSGGVGVDAEFDIPVTRVVLYSSGVAFVEHRGTVEGSGHTRLGFTPDQIKDVLKSMILMDQGGGRIEAVNYTSQDPISKALKSFSIDLSERPGLAKILDQLRGAEVAVLAPQAIQGRIIGVEYLPVAPRQGQNPDSVPPQAVVNLLCSDGIRAIPLSGISSIRPLDDRLNQELNKALELILGASDSQRKMVDISFAGKGKRKVSIGYITEAPVWKTSYRLDLKDQYLQGWAIVENVSDQDWNQVSLSLASGSPVSFIQDLYTPLYNPRPVVGPSVQANLQPQVYSSGLSAEMAPPVPAEEEYLEKRAMPSMAKAEMSFDEDRSSLADSGVSPQASTQKLGDLFFFAVQNPVSLPRRSGAMIPLVGQTITSDKISIYNQSVLEGNPMSGARMLNSTASRLPAGPITIFDSGAYGGDALIDSLGVGETRLISFAVDLDVQVVPDYAEAQDIQRFSLSKGVLYIQRLTRHSQTYHIANRSETSRKLVVEYPRTIGRSLVEPARADEEAPGLYRFNLDLAAGASRDFLVRETSVHAEQVSLMGRDSRTWLSYSTNALMSPKVKAALEQAASFQAKAADAQTALNDAVNQKAALEQDQVRLRANLEAVGSDSVQGKRYQEKLMTSEDQIEKLDQTIKSLRDTVKKAQAQLADYLGSLSVE